MSPEQAQGHSVDARSDVFSLGILLFEMATGMKPFRGDSNVSVLSAILKDTPPSVTDLRKDLPRDVGRVLRRCLAKDPEDRYQTAKDLRNDLRSLKEDLDSGATARDQTVSHDRGIAAQSGRAFRMRWVLLALGGVAVLAIGGWWYARHSITTAAPAFSKIEPMRRLTSTGTAMLAAISPDGRYLVHVDGNFDKQSLWMRQISTPASVQIVAPTAGFYTGLAFSPDSEAVLYVFSPMQGQSGSLFRIPLLGGPPRKLVDEIDTAPAFSPDGRRMAFVRGFADGHQAIILANADGSDQRTLASRAAADTYEATQVAWSPDGTLIAAFAGEMPKQRSRIVLVNAETGTERTLGEARFDSGGQLAWLRDGSALVFDAIEQYGGRWNFNSKVWSMAYPAGTLRRITLDGGSYSSVSATAGGRTLVAVRDEVRASLWVAPEGDSARARPITNTSDGREGATGIDWTPDGRIVYSATTQGSWDIWIADADGSHPRQLTSDPGVENQPQVLDGGQRILYTFRAAGASDVQVWGIDLDGSNPRQVPTGGPVYRGYLQAIGDHIYFKVQEGERLVGYRLALGGGTRAPLFADPTGLPKRFDPRSVSPDERFAVGTYIEPPNSGLAVLPIGGGPVRRFPYTYTPGAGFGVRWAPDGHAIEDLVFRDGITNLWRFPLDGSPPTPVTSFASEQIMNYRWSRTGRSLAISRGTQSLDVYLIASEDDGGKD
jgi:Tol biopolymer transport system component